MSPFSAQSGSTRLRLLVPVGVAAVIFLGLLSWLRDDAEAPGLDDASSNEAATAEFDGPAANGTEEVPGSDVPPVTTPPTVREYAGVVVDAFSGVAIAGAELRMLEMTRGAQHESAAWSDQSGRFRFAEMPTGPRTLTVSHPDYAPRRIGGVGPPPARIGLVPGVRVTGEVVSATGAPVAGAAVVAVENVTARPGRNSNRNDVPVVFSGEKSAEVVTGADGRFAIGVGAAEILLQARAAGHGPGGTEVIHVDPDRPPHVVIRLGEEHVLEGRVVAAGDAGGAGIESAGIDGAGIEGALVTVVPLPGGDGPERFHGRLEFSWEARSGADGAFRIGMLPEGTQSIRVIATGFVPYAEFEPNPVAEPRTLRLEPAGWLTGTLVAPDGRVLSARSGVLLRTAVDVDIEADGTFRSDSLREDSTQDELLVDGFVPASITWERRTGAIDVGTIELDPGRELEVIVTARSGEPVEGAEVLASDQPDAWRPQGARAYTDAQGRAVLRGIAGPSIGVKVSLAGYAPWSEVVALENLEGPVAVVLDPMARLTGRVADIAGAPLFGVQLLGEIPLDATGRRHGVVRASSAPDGRFVVEDVLPGKDFELRLTLVGRSDGSIAVAALAPGEERDLGLTELGGASRLVGRVEDPAGRGVAGAAVIVVQRRGTWQSSSTRSGDGGAFQIAVGTGEYSVSAHAEGYLESRSETVRVGDEESGDIVLTLREGTPFDGRVVDTAGRPVVGASVIFSSADRGGFSGSETVATADDGTFRFATAPVRDGWLRIDHDEYARLRRDYRDIAELDPTLVLEAATRIVVSLTMADGSQTPGFGRIRYRGPRGRSGSHGGRVVDGTLQATNLDPGSYEIIVSVRGYPPTEPRTVSVEEGQTLELDVTIPAKSDPVIIAVTGPTGEPVAGAEVTLWQVQGSSRSGNGLGNTDTDGLLHCEAAIGERTEVAVSAPGFAPGLIEAAGRAVVAGRLDVRLDPESAIELTVIEADGSPANGVDVRARARELPGVRFRDRIQTRDGAAFIGGLAPASYRLTFSRDGVQLGEETVELGAAEVRRVEFQLAETIEVTGVVLVNGEPVERGGIRVRGGSVSARTSVGHDGRFRVEVQGPGTYRFTYSDDAIGCELETRIEAPTEVRLECDTVAIRGVVLGPDDAPVAGLSGRLGSARFTTDDGGRFELPQVTVGRHQWTVGDLPPGTFAPREYVDVSEPTELVYRLLAARPLRITVTSTDGETVERPRRSRLGADGYRQGLVESGEPDTYWWPLDATHGVVSARNRAPTVFTVAPDQESVSVTLPPGGTLVLKLENADGESLGEHPFHVEPLGETRLHSRLRDAETYSSGGRSMALPVGDFLLRVTLPGGEELERPFSIAFAEETELTVP